MNTPPSKPGTNGKGKHISDKEIKERLKKIREEYIRKIEKIKKEKKPK